MGVAGGTPSADGNASVADSGVTAGPHERHDLTSGHNENASCTGLDSILSMQAVVTHLEGFPRERAPGLTIRMGSPLSVAKNTFARAGDSGPEEQGARAGPT